MIPKLPKLCVLPQFLPPTINLFTQIYLWQFATLKLPLWIYIFIKNEPFLVFDFSAVGAMWVKCTHTFRGREIVQYKYWSGFRQIVQYKFWSHMAVLQLTKGKTSFQKLAVVRLSVILFFGSESKFIYRKIDYISERVLSILKRKKFSIQNFMKDFQRN